MRKNKIIKGLKHYGKMCFSSAYRKKEEIRTGRKVWQKLDAKLEPAVGIKFDDDERLETFKRLSMYLTSSETDALKKFLRQKIRESDYDFSHAEALSKEVEKSRLKQIYREHLAVL